MANMDITIVGVGGAGCRIADRVVDALGDCAAVIALNTDTRALEDSHAATRLQIGASRTGGLGTGGDASIGRLAAEDDVELIRGLFPDTRFALVVACLGGGTGTGAAPVVLREAREAGALTLCLATLPCDFEGEQKRSEAHDALGDRRAAADALIVVPNDRLFESVGAADLEGTFRRADAAIGTCIGSLVKMIDQPGQINLDFADLQQIVRSSGGACTMGYGEGEGDDRSGAALAALLESPLLEKGRVLERSESILVSLVGGPDLTVKDVGKIMSALTAKAREGCRVSMGTVIDETWQGRVTVTVLAAEERLDKPVRKVAAPPVEYEAGSAKAARGRKKTRKSAAQTVLRLDTYGKGRFKDVEPTLFDGEDLDIPTFVRRGIAIDK